MSAPYYDEGGITIYHGDCREYLDGIGRVDLVLTDPPYDLHAGPGGGAFGSRDHLVQTGGFTDGGCDYSFLAPHVNWCVFGSRLQLPTLLALAATWPRWNLITWCKTNPVPTCHHKYLPDCEYAVHAFQPRRLFGDISVKSSWFLHPCGAKVTTHPNEKPVTLISKLVTVGSQVGDLVLDPYMGSGTTLVAAKRLERRAIGIEIEERYCEIAAKRLAQGVLDFGTAEFSAR